MGQRPNLMSKIIKLLVKNIGENLQGIEFGNNFIDIPPKAPAPKEKKYDLIKVKNFCALKNVIKKPKSQLTKWEKLFAYNIYDK